MPPRRRTFYLADATVLSNSKVRRLTRLYPDDWLGAWGAFHILVGVATLNGSPKLTVDDMTDTLGEGNARFAGMLQEVGLMTAAGIDPATFREWCPKPRPKYPSDSRGVTSDSDGISPTTAESGRITRESPTSSTSSSSVSKTTSATASKDGATVGNATGKTRGSALRGAAALDPDENVPDFLRAVQ